jgi:hypothetical protein
MFSYISLEELVPQAHPLRKLRAVVDALLATMNPEFEAVYTHWGRPSVPPEMLLKALLLFNGLLTNPRSHKPQAPSPSAV